MIRIHFIAAYRDIFSVLFALSADFSRATEIGPVRVCIGVSQYRLEPFRVTEMIPLRPCARVRVLPVGGQIGEMIISVLRDRTRHLHAQTEQVVRLSQRLVNLTAYGSFLACFYGFFAPLESRLQQIKGFEETGLDLEDRRKVRRIGDDLRAIGWSSEQIDELPMCRALPVIQTPAQGLGCLYVMEGSTLGGQFITREVHQRLGLTAGMGCSFFAGYGPERTGLMWKEFIEILNQFGQLHPDAAPALIESAETTFLRFKEWLECHRS